MERAQHFDIREYWDGAVVTLRSTNFFQKQILGKNKLPQVVDCEIQEIPTKSSNPKGIFHICKNKGISIFVNQETELIEYVTLYNEQVEAYSKYPYMLPYKLTWDKFNTDVVKRLGDTKNKGGGSIPIWITYEHLGIGFTFQNNDWADCQNPMTMITLFAKTKVQEECSLCLNNIKERRKSTEKYECACGLLFCSN